MTSIGEQDAQIFIEALGRLEATGDPEPLVGLFAQDSECDNVTATTSYRGPSGARDFWCQDRALFDEIRSEFRNVVAADDHIVFEWMREGSARDGDKVHFEGVSIIELRDGRITRFKAYYDPSRLGRQVA